MFIDYAHRLVRCWDALSFCQMVRHYQPLGSPLSKRASLNGTHSHFLLVDDGTMGKSGCQVDLRKRLERYIHFQKIHPSKCLCVLGQLV